MKKRFFLMIMALALLTAAAAGIFTAEANDGPTGLTWYANSPSGLSPSGRDTGTALNKFVDRLAGVGSANANNLGQYIPLAVPVPDTPTNPGPYPGSDYYEIGIREFTEKVHTDLPGPTKFRGYVDLTGAGQPIHYLGPLIVAKRDRPVRILFKNQLGTSLQPSGQLFIPVDPTLMNAGEGPLGPTGGNYTQNRTSIHLHGGHTPWYSDGTPHQWFTPPGETSPYLKGVSFRNIPDMPDPGDGGNTMYYPNQQGARLMFYHDHASAITRLNVYAGLAAGYIIHEPVEDAAITAGLIPGAGMGVYTWGIPLIIQDKTFVPKNIGFQDNKWSIASWGDYGSLYVPHIYEPNQSLTDPTGMNAYGRWDYGPWVQPNILAPVNPQAPELKAAEPLPLPATLNTPWDYPTSAVPEAFNDVMMVNGTVYPYLEVEPKAYRFRILNAANDRALNLQLYLDASGGGSGATATAIVDTTLGSPTFGFLIGVTPVTGGAGYQRSPGVNVTGGGGFGAIIEANLSGPGGYVVSYTVKNPGSGYTSTPTLTVGATTEVKMVAASPNPWPAVYPPTWPKDGRDGGVPDPATAGPKFIQIGNEGGFLPEITVRDNQPVNYDYDRGSATFGNVQNLEGLDPAIKGTTILLGGAERADVIVDFSTVAPGTNVILYNDAPTPMPGFQPRYDYYTGNPDLTSTGGAPQTKVGVGPNTRTIMQFRVVPGPVVPFNLANLQANWPNIYLTSQPPPIVPQPYYPGSYGAATATYASINAMELTYKPVGSPSTVTKTFGQKAIVEVFEQYGRLSANLGYEYPNPLTIPATSNGVGFKYIDPAGEIFRRPGETQIWKITHNGVDTHPVHIHLVNAQLLNRVGWDGVIKPPEPNERGWKETIRMNPLEVIYVAMRANMPQVPFFVGPSFRPYNPARPIGSIEGFTNINPNTGQPINPTPIVNQVANFGHEYVWHCHILAHEENDMMRPLILYRNVAPGTLDLLLLDN
jgi:FtsP/CotA-like multicopper oxidase with cupredoxin domain